MPKKLDTEFYKRVKFCEKCGRQLVLKITRDLTRKRFCSKSCRTKYINPHKGHKHSEETKRILGLLKRGVPNLKIRGEKHYGWKGGKTYQRGYVYLYAPWHPRGGYKHVIREHTLVMENSIGRYLKPDEVVHHINEIKDDNRIENLQLMNRSEHKTYHNKKMACLAN